MSQRKWWRKRFCSFISWGDLSARQFWCGVAFTFVVRSASARFEGARSFWGSARKKRRGDYVSLKKTETYRAAVQTWVSMQKVKGLQLNPLVPIICGDLIQSVLKQQLKTNEFSFWNIVFLWNFEKVRDSLWIHFQPYVDHLGDAATSAGLCSGSPGVNLLKLCSLSLTAGQY